MAVTRSAGQPKASQPQAPSATAKAPKASKPLGVKKGKSLSGEAHALIVAMCIEHLANSTGSQKCKAEGYAQSDAGCWSLVRVPVSIHQRPQAGHRSSASYAD